MIKTSSKQSGSAHVIIIVILVIALLGTLGFVFWKNYINKDGTKKVETETSVKKEEAPKPVTYKTYQTDTHPVSFKYPDTWNLENAKADDTYAFYRSVSVKTDRNDIVGFSIGGSGLGGTCGGPNIPIRSTIGVEPTTFATPKATTLSFTITKLADGTYDATYGLTDQHTKLKDEQICDNVFYYFFDSGNANYNLISFGGKKHFASLDDAKKFIASDEYSAIKKMILSLSY